MDDTGTKNRRRWVVYAAVAAAFAAFFALTYALSAGGGDSSGNGQGSATPTGETVDGTDLDVSAEQERAAQREAERDQAVRREVEWVRDRMRAQAERWDRDCAPLLDLPSLSPEQEKMMRHCTPRPPDLTPPVR